MRVGGDRACRRESRGDLNWLDIIMKFIAIILSIFRPGYFPECHKKINTAQI